jgi:phosphoribosylformylglycinamidine synthase PurS subunit
MSTIHLINLFFRRDELHESRNSCGISFVQGLAELGPPGQVSAAFRPDMNFLASAWDVAHIRRGIRPRISWTMKAKIIITPKKAVLDPQGKTVQNALAHMGYSGVGAVHVGKYLEIELAGDDPSSARKQIDEACHKILSNPVIEDYRFEIE